MAATLLQKVWDAHTVRILPTGQTQLFVGLHLIHEVTTPQAFDELRQRGWKVRFPSRTSAPSTTSFRPATSPARSRTAWPRR
jgi:3-isopropylmalate/(R)-2-methylmalate dehydratase large subunit